MRVSRLVMVWFVVQPFAPGVGMVCAAGHQIGSASTRIVAASALANGSGLPFSSRITTSVFWGRSATSSNTGASSVAGTSSLAGSAVTSAVGVASGSCVAVGSTGSSVDSTGGWVGSSVGGGGGVVSSARAILTFSKLAMTVKIIKIDQIKRRLMWGIFFTFTFQGCYLAGMTAL